MLNIGLKIKEYLSSNTALNELIQGQVYNRFMDDETINEPFLILDIDQITTNESITGEEYKDISFTINALHYSYPLMIELCMLIQSIMINDIDCGEYVINTIKNTGYNELYNSVYIGKLTFTAKIN